MAQSSFEAFGCGNFAPPGIPGSAWGNLDQTSTRVSSNRMPVISREFDQTEEQSPAACFDRRYRILSCLGKGGMSVIYKAKDLMLDRIVAVKVLASERVLDPNSMARLQREARSAANLRHPNIVNVYDFEVSQDGHPYLVMEYIDGRTLQDVISREGRLSERRTLDIFIEACQAFEHAHENGIIHRDIKPSNIMLFRHESKERVRIVDFGIAKSVSPESICGADITQSGEVFGSPIYMSPEQCNSEELDRRSDIYSLGCVLYECICGVPPFFARTSVETMMKHVKEAPQPMSERVTGVSPCLEEVVARAMQKDPKLRYQSMRELLEDLHKAQAIITSTRTTKNNLLAVKSPRKTKSNLVALNKAKSFPRVRLVATAAILLACAAIALAIRFNMLPEIQISMRMPGAKSWSVAF